MTRILVVEDEANIAMALEDDLKKEGYEVEIVRDGDSACRRALASAFDLILLDVMLPRKDGFDVCRDLRRARVRTPIVMLTAKTQEAEKVLGLELGADDYVVKPFEPKELLARVRAVLRRWRAPEGRETITVGDLAVDPARFEVRLADRRIDLTSTEFAILHVLARRPGVVHTRLQLLEAVHGDAYEGYERAIDSHIKNLRQKLEPDPRRPRYILTVHGVGYRLEAGDAA